MRASISIRGQTSSKPSDYATQAKLALLVVVLVVLIVLVVVLVVLVGAIKSKMGYPIYPTTVPRRRCCSLGGED
jgi:beta-lactamase regulating signal transducer with metallopeptidase domain